MQRYYQAVRQSIRSAIKWAQTRAIAALAWGRRFLDGRHWPYWLTRNWLASWLFSPGAKDFDDSPALQEMARWAKNYVPARSDEDVYTWACEYAETRYEEMLKLGDVLDKKLDDIMKTSGAVLTVLAAAARFVGLPSGPLPSLLLGLGLLLLFLALVLAARSRQPSLFTTPMDPKDLLAVADMETKPTKGQLEAALTTSYQCAITGTYIANDWKSKQLKRTTGIFCISLVLLPLAFLLPIQTSSRSSGRTRDALAPGTAPARGAQG